MNEPLTMHRLCDWPRNALFSERNKSNADMLNGFPTSYIPFNKELIPTHSPPANLFSLAYSNFQKFITDESVQMDNNSTVALFLFSHINLLIFELNLVFKSYIYMHNM